VDEGGVARVLRLDFGKGDDEGSVRGCGILWWKMFEDLIDWLVIGRE